MIDRNKYRLAKANGLAERFRGDEIARRISWAYPVNAQIAILMDKDTKPTEFAEYQAFRARIKAEVDAEIASL